MALPKGVFIETGKELNDRTFDEHGNNGPAPSLTQSWVLTVPIFFSLFYW